MSTVIITVLKPFSEVRSGRTYQPGDVISDPQWHAENDRRAGAYEARGLVKIEPAPEADQIGPVAPVTRKKEKH